MEIKLNRFVILLLSFNRKDDKNWNKCLFEINKKIEFSNKLIDSHKSLLK